MNRISVTELIEFIQDKDLLDTSLEQPEYSMNRPRRDEEWMFSNNEVPPMWSNKLVNIDQPFSLGQPLLAPLSKTRDPDFGEVFRFPFDYEFDNGIIEQGVTKAQERTLWHGIVHSTCGRTRNGESQFSIRGYGTLPNSLLHRCMRM